jgi:hypothetical protein
MMEIRRLGPIGAEIVRVDVKTMDEAAFRQDLSDLARLQRHRRAGPGAEIDDFLAYGRRFRSYLRIR